MGIYRVRIDDIETTAEIDDPNKSRWRGLVLESVRPAPGPAVVSIVTGQGVARSCEAEVTPPGSDGRTVLAGMTAFTANSRPTQDARVRSRADKLLPEEKVEESNEPTALADALLAESDERQQDRDAPRGVGVEHRRSQDTVDPT